MKLIDSQIKTAMRSRDKQLVLNLKTLKGEMQRSIFNLNTEISDEEEIDLINKTISSMIKSINKTFKNADKKKLVLSEDVKNKMNKDIETWEDILKLFEEEVE